MTERIVNSAVQGSSRTLRTGRGMAATSNGGEIEVVALTIHEGTERLADIWLTPENVVAALDGVIPGLSVSYEKPIEAPQGLGAVVRGSKGKYYIRTDENQWSLAPKRWVDDAWIERRLRDGAEILSEGILP